MRVLALIDMDSFYTQVEVKRDLSLRGKPVVVVQYNPYGDLRTLKPSDVRLFPDSNGSIIAASYEARKFGVKRNMMAQAAKKLCPELKIVQVPVAHGKADISIYREAGAQVINVLSSGAVCERASVDEAYLDVTAGAQQMLAAAMAAGKSSSTGQQEQQLQPVVADQPDEQEGGTTAADDMEVGSSSSSACVVVALPESVEGWHVAGMPSGAADVGEWWQQPGKSQDDQLLAAGAVIVARLRAAVAEQLGFTCSAGIAHSKILAKLGAGLNKPAQQTLVPAAAVTDLLEPLPISKLRALGGKFGEELTTSLGIQTVGELAAVPASRLEALVGEESATWLTRLAQGIDDLEVKARTLPKSISCGKTFRGPNAITGLSAVHKWLQELGKELQERIEADRTSHQRLPGLLTVSIDTLQGSGGAAADTGATAAAAVADGVGQNAAAAVAANGGRHTAQTWRAGAVNVSRSCNLRRPVAEVMAEDALKLVKKWARDRGQGWKIIGMFFNASNFVAAPTGASTLERFIAAAGQPQQPQQEQPPTVSAAPDATSPANPASVALESNSAATKRSAAAAGLSSSRTQLGSRGDRSKRAYGDLRAFLGPSTAAATAAAAATTATGSSDRAGAAAVVGPHEHHSMNLVASEEQQPLLDQQLAAAAAAVEGQGEQVGVCMETPPHSSAAAAVPGSSLAGQAIPVLSALSRLAPAGVAAAANQQRQRQRQQQQQSESNCRDERGEIQHMQQEAGQQQQHQADEPAVAASDIQQSPLPSQVVVGSLNGWLGAAQPTQQQEQQQSQQQQEEGLPELPAADANFEFHQLQQQQQQQPEDLAQQQMQNLNGVHLTQQQLLRSGQPLAIDGAGQQQQLALRMSDIDPSVLAELPYHIQVEVRRAAGDKVGSSSVSSSASKAGRGRGSKQQQKGQQGGSITKYFGKSK